MKNEENKLVSKSALEATIKDEIRLPSLFQVFVYNDDFTPLIFVVEVLEQFFYMDRRKATMVAMEAHMQGSALCGIYSKDFAEAKILQVMTYAKRYEHPLLCKMEVSE